MASKPSGKVRLVEVRGNVVFIETTRGTLTVDATEKHGYLVAYNANEQNEPTRILRG